MKLSVAANNPEGLSEMQIKERSQVETWPTRKYRPRRRYELSVEEQEDIVTAYRQSHLT